MLISLTKFRISHQQFHFSLVQSLISVRQSYISLMQSFISHKRQTINGHKTAVAYDIASPRTKSSTFAIEFIAVNGIPVKSFSKDTKSYTFSDLPYGTKCPVITYGYSGQKPDGISVVTNSVSTGYHILIKNGEEILYTVVYNINQTKPKALINTLYKLNADKELSVGY